MKCEKCNVKQDYEARGRNRTGFLYLSKAHPLYEQSTVDRPVVCKTCATQDEKLWKS